MKPTLRLKTVCLTALLAFSAALISPPSASPPPLRQQRQTSVQASVEDLPLVKSRGPGMPGLGIVVRDLDADSVVVSINPDAPMNPASVQKLVTGAAAFEILGPSYMHATRVYTDGEFLPDSGVIRGNLYIKGAGEPGFNAEKIWLLVQQLRHRGVGRVTGDLVIDNFFFDDIGVGPGFSEDESRAYQSLISALPANFSSVGLHHRPGAQPGSPVHVEMFPRVDGFVINNTAVTVAGNRGRLDVSTSLKNGVTTIDVKGTVGADEQPGYTYRRMWQTWDAFGGAFRAQCAQNGLRIDGKTVRRRVPDTLVTKGPFYTYGGDPLTEFVKHMFKWSSNFVSEMVFKTISVRKFGEPGSWPKGASAVEDWWQSRGLPGRPQIINGSGMGSARPPRRAGGRADRADGVEDTSYASAPALSGTENFISAGQMVALLTYVSKQKSYFPDYLSAFPVAGVDGTLRSRFNKSKLKGVVRGKTGTLNSVNVSTLAGYMLLDDKTYAFAVFCVGPKQYDNWTLQEQVLETVARVAGW